MVSGHGPRLASLSGLMAALRMSRYARFDPRLTPHCRGAKAKDWPDECP